MRISKSEHAIDIQSLGPYASPMEIPISPDLQKKLKSLADQQGRSLETLVVEAVEPTSEL